MAKRLPKLKSDKAAEEFLNQDISEYLDSKNFKKMSFEFAPKDKSVTLRVSSKLLSVVKGVADKQGVQYQRLMREAIEEYIKKKVI